MFFEEQVNNMINSSINLQFNKSLKRLCAFSFFVGKLKWNKNSCMKMSLVRFTLFLYRKLYYKIQLNKNLYWNL